MKLIKFILLLSIIFIIYYYKDNIVYFYSTFDVDNSNLVPNEYLKNQEFGYLNNFDDDTLSNRQDIINAYYSILNNGYDSYSLKCDFDYKECFDDFTVISKQADLLSHINNFVSPYNSFTTINSKSYNMASITIDVIKIYDDVSIAAITGGIDGIYEKIITEDMDTRTKIKTFHDYIINTVSYDSTRANTGTSNYSSNTAFGPLFEGKAICSGYSDVMALFLDKLGVINYRIASETHVWNYVYLDGTWYHLDLTWNDPITSSGIDVLDHTYFLITTEELEKLDKTEHTYNKTIYIEAS